MNTLDERMRERGYLPVPKVVSVTGLANHVVYRLIGARKVRSVKVGGRIYVELASVVAHLGPEASKLLGLRSRPPLPPEK